MNNLLLAVALNLTFPVASTNDLIPEVSTSIPLNVELAKQESLTFEISFAETNPTNNLEIAIGYDANANGTLELLEADRLFGYDCGRWYEADTRSGTVVTREPPFVIRRREFNPEWDTIRLTRRGWGELGEGASLTAKHVRFVIVIK